MTTISIIIPHLNQPAALEICLLSLAAQNLERDAFEIIVVDNGSRALPADVIARHPGVRLLQERRPGPGPARNMGVLASSGEVLAFIDADCRADADWLVTIRDALANSAPGTVLGGDVRIWRAEPGRVKAIEAYESVFAYRFKHYIERQGYAGTGNLAMFRRDFDAVGPFGGVDIAEDMEWGRRARAAGRSFRYIPQMIVYHPARDSLRELFAKWDRQILHYWRAAEGQPRRRLRWSARALLVLLSPLAGAVTALTSDRIAGAPARAKAVAVMVAVRWRRAATMLSLLIGERNVVWNR